MKRLKNIVASKNATQKKNNKGMTYIELLVALSLLVLIVTMFSPMLLRSYDSLYRAGEIAKRAYDARSEIERELAFRENNDGVRITTNFEKLSDSINVAARQIISSTTGLTTLYGEARGRLKVVSDNVVSDNQDYQAIRLLATNLDKDKYIRASSIDDAQNPNDDEVKFYIHSVFNDADHLDYTVTKDTTTDNGYVDVLIKNVNILKGPVKVLAYYKDTFGKVKKAETYLYIEPADMVLVGDSGANDFYTSGGVDKDGGFYIAGRQMDTAPIDGQILRDVEWVGTDNDSTILDGYYIMCGDSSVVRRLWRARDSSKSDNIAYKTTAINGSAYFIYDWKGDYTDRYTHISKKGAGDSGYGSSSTENSDSTVKDHYSLAGSHYAFAYNGHAGNWSDRDQMSRRISYIAYTNEDKAKADGHEPLMGMWSRYTNRSAKKQDVFNAKDIDLAYSPSDNQWYQRTTKNYVFYTEVNWNATGVYGADNWINEWNMRDTAKSPFYLRNGVPDGKDLWDSTSGHENRTGDVDHDEEIAYITLKIYNNFSKENLGVTADDAMPSAPADNLVQLTSCTALPGKSGDTMYFGRTNANALIQQTNATADSGSLAGLFTAYPVISQTGSNGEPEMRYNAHTQEMDLLTLATTGSSSVQPRSEFGAEQYAAHAYNGTNWGFRYDDVYFTMGYASDLYALYNSFTDGDTKPLESSYMASNGYGATHSKVTDSIWLPRNFYNIVESDAFGHSVVAVGYNFAGKISVNYNDMFVGEDDGYDYAHLKYKNGGSLTNSSNWRPETTAADFTRAVNDSGGKYILSSFTNESSDYWLKLPKHVVASTALNKVFNDGVLAIYNEGDSSFKNIYYYRSPDEQSVRFNCVSAFALSDTVVGAAVGMSNGKVMLAQIPYADGKLVETALYSATCPVAPAIAEITNVTAVKGVNYDIDGDETPETLILAAGVRGNSKPLVLRVCDTKDMNTYYAIQIQGSSAVTKVTDIAVINGYIYISAIQSDNSGVVFACELKELEKLNGKGSNTVLNLVTNVIWKTKTTYNKAYGVNSEGLVIGVGEEAKLPVINSIAGKAEQ